MTVVEECLQCRICKSDGAQCFETILDLGEQTIGSRFPAVHEEDPPTAPLSLVHCHHCGLVQLKHTVSADEMYMQTYGYRSGLNASMPKHLATIVDDMLAYVKPHFKPENVILDIGCNDSTLLQLYPKYLEAKLVGIDPTGLQFIEYYSKDIQLLPTFFNKTIYEHHGFSKAKCVTSISMFYDLPDPQAFVNDVAEILDRETGVWIMEQSYMPTMLQRNSFDTICHEHLEYYALHQIQWMCEKANLRILDVKFNDCNGGSFRVAIAHTNSVYASNHDHIQQILENETANHFGPADTDTRVFKEFQSRCETQKQRLQALLTSIQAQNKTVYLYGASTKGNTLLQYYGINSKMIKAAAERNPIKYGRRTPGTNIPILSEAEVRAQKPDYFLVLPWHFRDEFLEREAAYLQEGGQFIFPLPEVEVWSAPRKKALITGICGQIGSYLAEALLEKGYHVYGTSRDAPTAKAYTLLQTPEDRLLDRTLWEDILYTVRPDEVYHLAAQTSSEDSLNSSLETMDQNARWTILLIDIIASDTKLAKRCRFFHANSTEMFKGLLSTTTMDDHDPITTFAPTTPYGIGKLASFHAVKYYRTMKGLFACSGILTNTESARRHPRYVTQKICTFIKTVLVSTDPKQKHILRLGNLQSERNWIHCQDAVIAMQMLVQQGTPQDALVATTETNTIYDWLNTALELAALKGQWNADRSVWFSEDGNIEIHADASQTRAYETIQPPRMYPSLLTSLGWKPAFSLKEIIADMIKV